MNIGIGDRLRELVGARDGETLVDAVIRLTDEKFITNKLLDSALREAGVFVDPHLPLHEKLAQLIVANGRSHDASTNTSKVEIRHLSD